MGLRMSEQEEILGADLVEHGIGDPAQFAHARLLAEDNGRCSAFSSASLRNRVHPDKLDKTSQDLDILSPSISVLSLPSM